MKRCCCLRSLLAVAGFLFFPLLSFCQVRYLVPFRDGKLWGYADTTGKIVVTPQYDVAHKFQTGYARVQKGKRKGVLNAKVKEIVPVVYDEMGEYFDRYLPVTKDGRKGMIRLATGKIVVPLVYKDIRTLPGYHFILTDTTGTEGLYNLEAGTWVIPPTWQIYNNLYPWFTATFKDSTLHFTFESERLVFGKLPQREELPEVSDKTPPEVMMLPESGTQTYRMPTYERTETPGNMGWLYVVTNKGKSGVYSIETHAEIVPLLYDTVIVVPNKQFREFFIVRQNGKTGVVTKGNKVVVPLLYEEIGYSDSSAVDSVYIARLGGSYGLIKGRQTMLPFRYANITRWGIPNGFHLHKDNRQGGFVYRRNKGKPDILVEPKYDQVFGWWVMQPNNFDPDFPYEQDHKKGKVMVEVYHNKRNGTVDLQGREFFRN